MRCDKLLHELNQHIIIHMLSVNNVAHFLQESIEFEIPQLQDATKNLIIWNFQEIFRASAQFIYTLPVAMFTQIINSDDLNIQSEFWLVDIVKDFLDHHQQHGEKIPANPEDVAGPDVWARLTDAERKARTAEFTASKNAVVTAATNQKKEDAKKFHSLKSHTLIEDKHTEKEFWKKKVNCEYF